MRTSVIMTRKMGDFDVLQRTSDSMFNATKLLEQWNKSSGMQKQIAHFFENESTNEFINIIIEDESKDRNSVYLKSRGRHNGGTWMHPLLFIDFAMWLNPKFKLQVLKFVQDEMIKHRNNAGDAYSMLASSIQSLVGANSMKTLMPNVSKGINYVVFNNHCTGERNKHGEQDKQQELYALEIKISELIDEGFLKSYEQVMQYLRERWAKKYTPKALR